LNYGSLISEAFWLTWRHRFLWFFGFFAGGSASFNFNVGSGSQGGDVAGAPPAWAEDLVRWISDNLVLFLTIVISVVVLVVLVLIALSMLSQGGLVDSVAALHRGETRRFSLTWRAGFSHFWRVLGLKALLFLISVGLALAIIAPVALAGLGVFSSTDSVGLIVLFVIFAVLVVIALFVLVFVPLRIIGQLALRELVLGGERVGGSIRAGFGLFRRNLGRSLLLWVILVVLLFAAGAALLIATIVLGLAVFIPVTVLLAVGFTAGAVVIGVVGALILLVPFVVISGAIGAFGSTYWTLAYLRLADPAEGAATQPGQGV
ncbi:MAG: hypothetical protein M3246_02330, partial [Actinomycetota bacterium]|nr:hypothetical protein [Actinomycetota bacterium]